MTHFKNRIKVVLCVLTGCAFMASPVFFSDIVQGQSTNTQSVFPLDKITRDYNCEAGYYALTFDDGPFPGHTENLVAMLNKYHIPATFFNTGEHAASNPKLVALERTVGPVGGHSYGHDDYTKLHPTVIASDIKRTLDVLPGSHFFRPPFGATNADVSRAIKTAGQTETMWTVDTKDFEAPYTVERLVKKAAEVKDGGIILMHDGWPNTVRAVPEIVNDLHARGLCPGHLVKTLHDRQIMMDAGSVSPYPFNAKAVKP
jgi:peptidoglycan/xylan/chitin deacetylase (PgdA/CDA1 family)